jgi:hypothetical protein
MQSWPLFFLRLPCCLRITEGLENEGGAIQQHVDVRHFRCLNGSSHAPLDIKL